MSVPRDQFYSRRCLWPLIALFLVVALKGERQPEKRLSDTLMERKTGTWDKYILPILRTNSTKVSKRGYWEVMGDVAAHFGHSAISLTPSRLVGTLTNKTSKGGAVLHESSCLRDLSRHPKWLIIPNWALTHRSYFHRGIFAVGCVKCKIWNVPGMAHYFQLLM